MFQRIIASQKICYFPMFGIKKDLSRSKQVAKAKHLNLCRTYQWLYSGFIFSAHSCGKNLASINMFGKVIYAIPPYILKYGDNWYGCLNMWTIGMAPTQALHAMQLSMEQFSYSAILMFFKPVNPNLVSHDLISLTEVVF